MADENTDLSNIPGVDTLPSTDPETASALDAALLEATEGAGEDIPLDGPAELTDEEKAAEKAATDKAAADRAAADKAEADKPKPEPDELDAVQLPTNVKPKTGEAFEAVKVAARAKIGALSKETETLKAKLAEFETKYKDGGLTPEVKAELEELRSFRNRLDVEADPQFKDFDKKVEDATGSIYKKLTDAGAGAEVIKKIQDLGGINGVNWDDLLPKIPTTARRFIESKLVEVEDLTDRKAKAVEAAKKNASEYVAAKSEQTSKQRELATKRAVEHGEELAKATEWMKEKTAPANATPAQKAEVEAHNKLVADGKLAIKEAASDDSPEMRAALGLGVAELLKTRADFDTYKAVTTAEIAQLTKDLKAANDLLERVKKGSTARLRNTPAGEETKPKGMLVESGTEAIDRLAREAAGGNPL